MHPTDQGRAGAGRRGFTIVELLAVIAVLALLIALLLPATRSAREPARRMQCTNNLRQIGLALHNYERAHGAFPPAYTVDARGRPLHSWRTLILPYMEQRTLYESIDLTRPWDHPANTTAGATRVFTYLCPSGDISQSKTPYLAIAAPDGALHPTRPRPLDEITDGLNQTVLMIEAGPENAVPWMAPLDADATIIPKLGPNARPHHPSGGNALFADGSVRFLKTSFAPATLRALMTIAGGEDISSDAY